MDPIESFFEAMISKVSDTVKVNSRDRRGVKLMWFFHLQTGLLHLQNTLLKRCLFPLQLCQTLLLKRRLETIEYRGPIVGRPHIGTSERHLEPTALSPTPQLLCNIYHSGREG